MSEFINTIEVLGDEATIDAIIERTITEFKDDTLTEIGKFAFAKCTALTTVDLPKLQTTLDRSFENCIALTNANIPSLTVCGESCFNGCTALSKLKFLSNVRLVGGCFYNCSGLIVADYHQNATIGGHGNFYGCTNLSALIFRGETLVTLAYSSNVNNSSIASGTGYIYVPRALVDSYKAATNWSTYATQFRALEDYTVDGTVTGELDETKI